MNKIEMPVLPTKEMPTFSDDDISRILAICDNPRSRTIVLFLMDSGVRISELSALNVGDVSMNDGAVTVRQGGQSMADFSSKSDKEENLPS